MAEKKSIHEFSTGTPQAQTAFVVDTPNASAESGYVTEKVITSDLGNTLLGTLNYTQSLDTESKNIFGAVNELKENSVNFEEEAIPDIPERELPYYPSGEYSSLNTNDKHIVGAINEVKEKLTTYSKTVTPLTGTTIDNVSFIKCGNIVNLIMRVEIASPRSWMNIATIPTDCSPNEEAFGVMVNTSASTGVQTAHIGIYANGTIKLGNTLPDAGKKYVFSMTWLIS